MAINKSCVGLPTVMLKFLVYECNCSVHYVGKYDGRVFEDREVSFILGEGSEVGVVDGIELGLRRMTKGETARFRVHSLLAYGKEGNEIFEIPPDADLDYEIDLKNFVKVNVP